MSLENTVSNASLVMTIIFTIYFVADVTGLIEEKLIVHSRMLLCTISATTLLCFGTLFIITHNESDFIITVLVFALTVNVSWRTLEVILKSNKNNGCQCAPK